MLESSTLLPVLLALASALLFAFGDQFQNQGLAHLDSRTGAAISIGASTLFFLALTPWWLDLDALFHPAVLIFALIGLFRPSLSINLALAGMRHMGPTLATTLTSTSPLFATGMGLLWLGEALTVETGVGTLVIVVAIMILAKRDGGAQSDWPVWALLLPLGAALIRSGGHVLSKFGMNHVPDPYLASLVTFAVSAVITTAIHRLRRDGAPVVWYGPGVGWFVAAGFLFSLAVMALNGALLLGTVVQVVPLVSASPIFIMLMSVFVFRRERITPRTFAVVFMVVPAVMLIALAG